MTAGVGSAEPIRKFVIVPVAVIGSLHGAATDAEGQAALGPALAGSESWA